MFLQRMIQESESSTLSSHRSIATTSKPNRIIISLRRILGYDAKRLINSIVMNEAYIGQADIFNIRIVLNLQLLHMSAYCEQTACKEPFR